MPALRALSVSCKNVDDAGVADLPSFPALRELMPMDVPDEGYRHIARCEALESLILMYCRETSDVATEHIVRLPNLKNYFASYTRITDRTPELLSRMDSLERITLDSCSGVTSAGLAHLSRLPGLRELRVSGPQINSDILMRVPLPYPRYLFALSQAEARRVPTHGSGKTPRWALATLNSQPVQVLNEPRHSTRRTVSSIAPRSNVREVANHGVVEAECRLVGRNGRSPTRGSRSCS